MSDAAREIIESVLGPCPEWVLASHRKAVQPILDAYAAERTAAEAAKHADCCVDRQEMTALRAALDSEHRNTLALSPSSHQMIGDTPECEVCRFLAAPEAAP